MDDDKPLSTFDFTGLAPLYTSDDIRECTFPVGLAEFLANIKPAKARALAIESVLRKVAASPTFFDHMQS